jgi:hypothetical protein
MYEIDEIHSPHGISRFSVIVRRPGFGNRPGVEERFGAVGSRLPPDYTPGFWSIGEAQDFIDTHRKANAVR